MHSGKQMEQREIDLNDAILASLLLLKPVLVTSENPSRSLQRVTEILGKWPGIQPNITFEPTHAGLSVFTIDDSDLTEQLKIHKAIRRHEYPLILFRKKNAYLSDKLKSHILFELEDDITKATPEILMNGSIVAAREKVSKVTITTEVQTYIYDLVVELRYSRFIRGGIPTYILFDLMAFVKFWAFRLGKQFVTPLISKACLRIVLPLRIHLITPEEDPTLMYGSDLTLVTQLVNAISVQDAIDIAITKVRPPI